MKTIDVYDDNIYGPAPLYNRPPGELVPRTAYLEINPVAREISTGYNLEPADRPPSQVRAGLLVWIDLPPTANAEAVKELLHDPTTQELAGRVCDGYTEVIDHRRGRLGLIDVDARGAIKELRALAGKIKLDRVMTAEEYLGNAKAESLWFEGETLERAADKLMEVAAEEKTIIDGDMDEALKHHVIAEYNRVGSLPKHIVSELLALAVAELRRRVRDERE